MLHYGYNASMTDTDVLTIFEESGALLSGHFVLTSGKHSDRYFEKFHVLNKPAYVETLCREIAARAARLEAGCGFGADYAWGVACLRGGKTFECACRLRGAQCGGQTFSCAAPSICRPDSVF